MANVLTTLATGGVEFYDPLEQGSPGRDFGPRRADDIYRVLFGGTDFATGNPVADKRGLAKQAKENALMVRLPSSRPECARAWRCCRAHHRWAKDKDENEARPADEAQAKHVGAQA